MEVLPSSLSYSASKQSLRINRFQSRPTSGDSGGPNSTFRFNLPSKSLVDLSSFVLAFDLTVSGLLNTAADNYSNVKLPHGHKLIKSLKVYVGGQAVSGHLCNDYDILHNALLKASAGEDWCNSRYNEHTKELIASGDDITALAAQPGATSKAASYLVSDFLGIFRGNGSGRSIIDTSLWGDVSIEVTLNNEGCMAQYKIGDATTTNITFSVTNMESYVSCITQTTPLYIKLITMLLDSREQQIRFPYQNFVSNISTSGSNARFQVNSGCIDSMVVVPLSENYQLARAAAGAANINPAGQINPTRYRYDSGKACDTLVASKGCAMQIQIGSDTFPKLPIDNALHVSNITQDSLFSNSLYSQNLLFNDLANAASSYNRTAFLNENFVWVQSFCDQEGWASKILTGIDTASQNLDIILNTAAKTQNGSVFMGALLTSMLVFDTKTGVVSVVQ
jgi:hypothetical protein